jgi:hypothetical protein
MKIWIESALAVLLCMGLATLFVAWFALVFAVIHAYVFCGMVQKFLLD